VHLNEDQLSAAKAESRKMVNHLLGLPADTKPDIGLSPFVEELLVSLTPPDAPRCKHLWQRPMQPWMLMLPFRKWHCKACFVEFGRRHSEELKQGYSLGPIEEFTCDRCRTYVGKMLNPLVIRQDLWTIVGSVCDPCMALGIKQGGRMK